MLRITNLTNKSLDITKNVTINPRSYLDVQTSITPRLYQMMNMGVIKIQEINEKSNITKESNIISEGSLRRKQMMEKIRKGETKQGVSLDVSLYKQTNTAELTKPKRGKRGK